MDILSDIISNAGLRRRLLSRHALDHHSLLHFPCNRSLGLHVVTQGQVFVHSPNLKSPLSLQTGDLALMARGCAHELSLSPAASSSSRRVIMDWAEHPTTAELSTTRPPSATANTPQVISAAYQLWHEPLHPFLRNLPAWFVLRADKLPTLSTPRLTIGLIDRELNEAPLGSSMALNGLLDAVFAMALREISRQQTGQAPNLNHAVTDRAVREVLTLMQGHLQHRWTLEELAQRGGVSRSGLAERFRTIMGETPLSHLRNLRMQKAMQLLSENKQSIEQIAQAVGYQDAFSFSKLFKRCTSLTPGQFRKKDAAENQSPWRIHSSTGTAARQDAG